MKKTDKNKKAQKPKPGETTVKATELTEQELEQVQGGRAPAKPTIIINY